jgi:TRAP-type C4-dicarboxylate transport system permease small subunit
MLEKFERFNETVSGWAESIALGAVLFMVALTCVDVLGAKLFRLPVPGSLDMMMLAQLIAVSFAGAMTLIRDRHVSVEFFVMLLPRRARALIDCAVRLLCLGLFAIIVWRLFSHGYHLQTGGERTPTIQVPLAPFSYAAALATVPMCLVFAQQLLSSILRVVRNES